MMTWAEFINHVLSTTHKIQKVAVFTEDGQPVAVTEDLQVSPEEGQAIARCIADVSKSVTKVHIDNNFYTVFKGNDQTIIGTSPGREHVFVAYKQKDAIIVVFGKTMGHGSFLFELKKNLLVKETHRAQTQQRHSGGQGQIQQILHAAEVERMAEQEADDSQLPEDMEQDSQMFEQSHATLADDQVLLELES